MPLRDRDSPDVSPWTDDDANSCGGFAGTPSTEPWSWTKCIVVTLAGVVLATALLLIAFAAAGGVE